MDIFSRINGLDLFSGIGGITIGLAPWVRPIAYCERDRYCQGVLLSRMREGTLPLAPIWDDVQTLTGQILYSWPDIIYGGFPCQDISVAGHGKGLAGERSGLYWEIHRLAGELKPQFIFLENVPAITTRGGIQVVESLTALGYDCRWTVLSASAVGANHRRERWFLLAHTDSQQHEDGAFAQRRETATQLLADPAGERCPSRGSERERLQGIPEIKHGGEDLSKPGSQGLAQREGADGEWPHAAIMRGDWWTVEPDVGRVAHGIPRRVDRIKALGNAVVPLQVRTGFKILSGLN